MICGVLLGGLNATRLTTEEPSPNVLLKVMREVSYYNVACILQLIGLSRWKGKAHFFGETLTPTSFKWINTHHLYRFSWYFFEFDKLLFKQDRHYMHWLQCLEKYKWHTTWFNKWQSTLNGEVRTPLPSKVMTMDYNNMWGCEFLNLIISIILCNACFKSLPLARLFTRLLLHTNAILWITLFK